MPKPRETEKRPVTRLHVGDRVMGDSVRNKNRVLKVTKIEKFPPNGYKVTLSDGEWSSGSANNMFYDVVTR
jgi:hypothetical protein